MNNLNTNDSIQNLKYLDDFITSINNELSAGCMVPISLPKKISIDIVERAKEYFYKFYGDALVNEYYYISPSIFSTQLFKEKQIIQLPGPDDLGGGRIYSVNNIYVPGEQIVSGIGRIGMMDRDFSLNKLLLNAVTQSSYLNINGDGVLYYIMTEYYFDLIKNIMLSPISFDYNRLTLELRILGRTPKDTSKGYILDVFKTIPDSALYKDEIFFRYVLAYHKKVLGEGLTMFDFNLPGNIKINGDALKTQGIEELEKIKEDILKQNPPNFIVTS